MILNREQYLDLMTFGGSRRPIFGMLFGPMEGLVRQWRRCGASRAELDFTAFGFDSVKIHRLAVNTSLHPLTDSRVLEEDDECLIELDPYGRRTKLYKTAATIPLPLEYPVTDWDSWLEFKPRYEFSEDRFADAWDADIPDDALVIATLPGGFDEPRQLMGDAGLCVAYYDQPELVHDMLETMGRTAARVLEIASRRVRIDQLSVHEDMAGKGGPLVGPAVIDEYIRPYYRRVWDMLQSRGARLFSQDSDGNMNAVTPAFLDAGLNVMFPCEPAAGMDAVEVRKTYGQRLGIVGGLDKFALLKGRQAIRAELEYKMQASMLEAGGIVFGADHRIPDGVKLEDFWYFVRTAREMLGLDGEPQPCEWVRLAF
jgi:hypothetical protein